MPPFGFDVLPLAISNGAGSGRQNTIGTGVLGGMIAATLIGIFFVVIPERFKKRTPNML